MRRYLIFILIPILFTSCVPRRKLLYLQDNPLSITTKNTQNATIKTTIQSGDNLFIKVITFDEKSMNNLNIDAGGGLLSNASLDLLSFAVQDSGYIKMPYVGKIYLLNKTLDEAQGIIEKAYSEYLEKPSVIIKFVNRYFSILGEVNRPGKYDIFQDETTIFQALSLAGDIAYFGDRSKIAVIRNVNSIPVINYVDITDKNLLNSPFYYIKPNDIIYIEPLKNKEWGIATFPFATVLSSVTTLILILNYIKK